MDLDNFESDLLCPRPGFDDDDHAIESTPTPQDALIRVDNGWYAKTMRSGRLMDLIGDYAGAEKFIIDGEALVRNVLNDPLLALGRGDGVGFQLLHAIWSLESELEKFTSRGASFDVVFLRTQRHQTVKPVTSGFVAASLSLARRLLFRHLKKISAGVDFGIYCFASLQSAAFNEYLKLNRPMFVMTNTQDTQKTYGKDSTFASQYLLDQRMFVYDILSAGISVAELHHVEFKDSKILTFIFEQRRLTNPRVTFEDGLWDALKNARDALDALELKNGTGSRYPLDAHAESDSDAGHPLSNLVERLLSEKYSKTSLTRQLLLPFIAHSLGLEQLGLEHRAQVVRQPRKKIAKVQTALATIFGQVEEILISKPLGMTVDIDGHVFMALVRTICTSKSASPEEIFGQALLQRLLTIIPPSAELAARQLQSPELGLLRSMLGGLWHVPTPSADIVPRRALLPFHHSVFDEHLQSIRIDEAQASPTTPSRMDFNTPFSDTRHWHAHKKSILPKHLGGDAQKKDGKKVISEARARQRRMRADQLQMKQLRNLAETLTGALGTTLQQVIIAPVGIDVLVLPSSGKTKERKKTEKSAITTKGKEKPPKKSKADLLRENIAKEKQVKEDKEAETWWTTQLAALQKLASIEIRKARLEGLLRNKRAHGDTWLASEVQLYAIHLELMDWINNTEQRMNPSMHDRYCVDILRRVRALYQSRSLTHSVQKKLASVLKALGFEEFVPSEEARSVITHDDHPLSFDFFKLVKSKTGDLCHKFMRISESPSQWQLRVFGEFMDRSMDSVVDSRVPFEPDGWQHDVLNCLDEEKSILVVAPTSAGKTFISYYAMEQVLRSSDNGVLVYVAPTKALVMQIAAEVYARYKKDLNGPSCWAVHTRDFRINDPQNCQILVTVPEMLAIMLLSPPLARVWTPRIKRIVLDEIHSIGQQEGGAVWEQILLLAPCPIIGLSATIGNPEIFSDWLESVQRSHGFDYKFIHWPTRYSHLRKHAYLHQIVDQQSFAGFHTWKDTERIRFTHPLSLLPFGLTSLPSDLALEARDLLSTFEVMVKEGILSEEQKHRLNPDVYFSATNFLRQKDVLAYEADLKTILLEFLEDPLSLNSDSSLQRLVSGLQDSHISNISEASLVTEPNKDEFLGNLLPLLCDLDARGDLPGLLFSFDRNYCEVFAQHLLGELAEAEKKWRSTDPGWLRKEQQWREWLFQRVRIQKEKEKTEKTKKRKDEAEGMDGETESWENSFDPSNPSLEFSFTGLKSTYSLQQLAEDLEELSWSDTPTWAKECLKRGIGVHHAGMNKKYRSLVERLFRLGFLRVVICTGSLALGINAPTRTTVFCGDSPYLTALMFRQCAGRAGRRGFDLLGKVVFYGLSFSRIRRLVYSKLPSLGGNFPVSSTMCLRLFNLLEGSGYAPVAVKAVKSLLELPRVSFSTETGNEQLLHHMRFSIEYLRRSQLLSAEGLPLNLFGVAAHLYHTEPSNFALVALIRSGVFHELCRNARAKENIMLVLCHLFGRRYLPSTMAAPDLIRHLASRYPSRIVLPPLPKKVRAVLKEHNDELVTVFTNYAVTYATHHEASLGPSSTLPLSQISLLPGDATMTQKNDGNPSLFVRNLSESRIQTIARSVFVANSGHSDKFSTISELSRTAREGLHLNEHAVPSMDHILQTDGLPLNAYLMDFWTHGQPSAIVVANGIRQGDLWYLFDDFNLTLMTIRGALETLIKKAVDQASSNRARRADGDAGSASSSRTLVGDVDTDLASLSLSEGRESDFQMLVDDSTLGDDDVDSDILTPSPLSLDGVSEDDKKVLKVVDEILTEFNRKFKAMWA